MKAPAGCQEQEDDSYLLEDHVEAVEAPSPVGRDARWHYGLIHHRHRCPRVHLDTSVAIALQTLDCHGVAAAISA